MKVHQIVSLHLPVLVPDHVRDWPWESGDLAGDVDPRTVLDVELGTAVETNGRLWKKK